MATRTFIMSSTSTDFETTYYPTISLYKSKKYEAALISLDTYNSIPNITGDDNNPATTKNCALKYSTDLGKTWKIKKLDTGSYELSSINNEIQRQMVVNGDYDHANNLFYITLTANISELKSIINITNPTYTIDFNVENSLASTLGFGPTVLGFGYHELPSIVDIIKINSIHVNLDLIEGSYVNGSREPTIYSFYPSVSPGYKIIEKPTTVIYYPVSRYTISKMRVWLTDQNNIKLNLRGEVLSVRIAL